MTSLDLTIVLPGTADALERGCTCPDPADRRTWPAVIFSCGGYVFSPDCPVHRYAVRAEVQRLLGVAQ